MLGNIFLVYIYLVAGFIMGFALFILSSEIYGKFRNDNKNAKISPTNW